MGYVVYRIHTWENAEVFNAKAGGEHNYQFCVSSYERPY